MFTFHRLWSLPRVIHIQNKEANNWERRFRKYENNDCAGFIFLHFYDEQPFFGLISWTYYMVYFKIRLLLYCWHHNYFLLLNSSSNDLLHFLEHRQHSTASCTRYFIILWSSGCGNWSVFWRTTETMVLIYERPWW